MRSHSFPRTPCKYCQFRTVCSQSDDFLPSPQLSHSSVTSCLKACSRCPCFLSPGSSQSRILQLKDGTSSWLRPSQGFPLQLECNAQFLSRLQDHTTFLPVPATSLICARIRIFVLAGSSAQEPLPKIVVSSSFKSQLKPHPLRKFFPNYPCINARLPLAPESCPRAFYSLIFFMVFSLFICLRVTGIHSTHAALEYQLHAS